jgi:hypothetical protein
MNCRDKTLPVRFGLPALVTFRDAGPARDQRRYSRGVKVGAALTAIVIAGAGALLAWVDLGSSPTAGLVYVFVPREALGLIVLIWLGVLVALAIRRGPDDRRFANRNAKSS